MGDKELEIFLDGLILKEELCENEVEGVEGVEYYNEFII